MQSNSKWYTNTKTKKAQLKYNLKCKNDIRLSSSMDECRPKLAFAYK